MPVVLRRGHGRELFVLISFFLFSGAITLHDTLRHCNDLFVFYRLFARCSPNNTLYPSLFYHASRLHLSGFVRFHRDIKCKDARCIRN